MIYYHGSSANITGNYLEPRSSHVINNEKAVFATNDMAIALAFIPKWSDNDFSLGIYNGKKYMVEQYSGAFNKIFKGSSGWIFEVDGSLFKTDKRLGLKNSEFISKKKVPIVKRTYIKDVFKSLKKTNINLVLFDDSMQAIEQYVAKKMKNI